MIAETVTADAVEDSAHARAETFAGSLGLGNVSILVATAEGQRATEAFVGSHGGLDLAGGNATFTADATPSTPLADAASLGLAGGLIANVSIFKTTAIIGHDSVARAFVGDRQVG